MNKSFFENILEYKKFSFAWLSDLMVVISSGSGFTDYCMGNQKPGQKRITDLVPETVGLENTLREILAVKRGSFTLEYLNRVLANGEERYFSLSFFRTGDPEVPLFCLVEDTTEAAIQKQQIAQQKNEILLLESFLAAKGDFLSASILGESEPIEKIRQMVGKISQIPAATVLLLGESGTGKSLVAKVIHYSSQESKTPFVEINCAAIPETLLESELFGYEKGAFTGAVASRKGLLEEADGGTLFLDEIGELPLKLQAKLLTFLETRKFRRLGSNAEQDVKVRLIAATNRNLDELIGKGEFREDLLYRLKVVTINLPGLRELDRDVILIAHHFLQIFNIEFKKHVTGFSKEAEQKLIGYQWPGNVRELSNVIERAMIFIETGRIESSDLVLHHKDGDKGDGKWTVPVDGISLENVEKQLILSALERAGGNKSRAARLLGLSRDTFRYRLEKFNLD
ncbi:MAG: sigma-54 interaction domain-containing protein [Calditrichaceae bacterium]